MLLSGFCLTCGIYSDRPEDLSPPGYSKMTATFDRLNKVFQEVFDDDELVVKAETTAKDVDGWDSMMHVRLLINVERAFNLKFSFSEMASLENVGDLVSLIDSKIQA